MGYWGLWSTARCTRLVQGAPGRAYSMTRSEEGDRDEPGGLTAPDDQGSPPEASGLPPPPPRPQLVAGDMPLIMRRVGASIIDFTLAFTAIFAAAAISGVSSSANVADDSGIRVWMVAVPLVYRWGMQAAVGFTIGKWALGLRLVCTSGRTPGPFAVFGREVLWVVLLLTWQVAPESLVQTAPILSTLLVLGPLADVYMMFRRSDTRALHDLPFKTRVIRVMGVDGTDAPGGGPRRFT